MSIWRVDNTNISGVPSATMVRRFRTWTWIHVQVRGANSIRIAVDRSTLEQVSGNNVTGGLLLTAALTVTPYQGWWIGELWAIADLASAQPANFDLETMQQPLVREPSMRGEEQVQAQVTSSE